MQIIEQMLDKYDLKTTEDRKNAIKEIMQEIVLSGLSRANFFKEAAFYGGTALRIFHNLDRFSEDLDFSLMVTDPQFKFNTYIDFVKNEVESLGLSFKIDEKNKTNENQIKAAILKGNTLQQFLVFYPNENQLGSILHAHEKIKVKFEIDTNPPAFATTEIKYRLLPYPFEVRIYDLPSLFAGKIDAVLNRNWKQRIKGRDLYDYIYFIARGVAVNMKHLKARLIQSKYIDQEFELSRASLIKLLNQRFNQIDYEEAKKDIIPFVKDIDQIRLWSADFFINITSQIKTQ